MTVPDAFIISPVCPAALQHRGAASLLFPQCRLAWLRTCTKKEKKRVVHAGLCCARSCFVCVCVHACDRRKTEITVAPVVSAPSYLLHSQKQVYKLIGKCQTQESAGETRAHLSEREGGGEEGEGGDERRADSQEGGGKKQKGRKGTVDGERLK